MSNYTKTTDFEAKDSLPTGDAEKIIRGADFETEFDNIATAIATKADTAGPTFTGIVTIPTAAVTTLSLDGTTVTSTAAEINLLDGVTATTAELNLLDGVTATTAELNILDGVTATAAELNTLDGITSTTAELNTLDGFTGTYEDLNFAQTLRASGVTGDEFDILDGLTATAAELNILDGATVTTAELNLLDGVTATTAELNILDGVTSTAAELNILDGVTSTAAELNLVDGSTAGTVVNSKAVVYGAAGEVNATTLQVGGVAITSTPAELNLLDGATVTTAEINILDGVTATTAELNILDGVTATATELNTLDGITSTTAELNILDGVTATAAELNTMDGITATTAELNILDGVTADATELNKLDGVTATTSELNYVDVTTLGFVEASKAVTADANADVLFGDNDKLKFGTGSDLQIYHDGNNSFIDDQGTGSLVLQSNGAFTVIQNSSGVANARFDSAGAASIRYNGVEKLATTSTGIDVTGSVTADGAEIDVTRSDTAGSGFLTLDLVGTGGDFAHRVDTSNAYYLDYYTGSAWRPTIKIEGQTGDISFYEDTGTTAKFFWDASAESLGIGTSSPASPLTVMADSVSSVPAAGADSSHFAVGKNDQYGTMIGTLGSGVGYIQQQRFDGTATTYDLLVQPNGGNVGIGTSSPDTELHVSSSTGGVLRLENTDTTLVADQAVGAIEFESNDGSTGASGVAGKIDVIADGTTPDYSMRFFTLDNQAGTADFSERMRITKDGNLLVGATSVLTASETTNTGFRVANTGGTVQVRDGGIAQYINRLTSDGDITVFQKDGATVGSIGTKSADLCIGTDDTGIRFGDGGNSVIPHNMTTNVTSDGVINFGTATERFKDLYLSGGAYLGGTAAANKLDDYEEGTWTPTLTGNTTAGSYTVTPTGCRYTKIGRLVTVTGKLAISVTSSGTGTARFSGLPFITDALSTGQGAVRAHNINTSSGMTITATSWTSNSADFALSVSNSNAGVTNVQATDIGSASIIEMTFQYETAA